MTKLLTMKDVKIKNGSKPTEIYPVNPTDGKGEAIKSIGFTITKEEAINLATQLLAGAANWELLRVSAMRKSNTITVTSYNRWNKGNNDEV